MWWPFTSSYPERRPEDADSHAFDYVVVGGTFLEANLHNDDTSNLSGLSFSRADLSTWKVAQRDVSWRRD